MRLFLLASCLLLACTSRAVADCASDFVAINHPRPGAGPYEIDAAVLHVLKDGGGKREIRTETQIILPGAVASKNHNTVFAADTVITGGKGWIHGKDGWQPMQRDDIDKALDRVAKGFIYAKEATNIECLGMRDFQGRKALAFRYDATTSGYLTKMTAYFDSETKLPVGAESFLDMDSSTATTTLHYRFDPSIRIEPPAP